MKESHKVIGNIYYGNRDFEAKEVGYIVNKNYQRRGFASEALAAVIENAFSEGFIGFLQSVTQGIFARGNFWRRLVYRGKHI